MLYVKKLLEALLAHASMDMKETEVTVVSFLWCIYVSDH